MSNLREFSLCGSSVSAVGQIEDLKYDEEKETIVSIKVMHSANLKSMQGLQPFSELLELTLSDNSIEKIEALQPLVYLRLLNLSCNRIRKIEGLATLIRLEKLILASNRIESLHPLSQIGGEDYSLAYFDAKDNKLRDLSELQHLNCLVKLKELHLTLEEDKNPIFQDKARYIRMLSMQPIVEQLQKIDGKTSKIFFSAGNSARKKQIKGYEENQEDSFTENIQSIDRQHWSPDFASSPPKQKRPDNQVRSSSNKARSSALTDRALRSSSKENIEDQYHVNYHAEGRHSKRTQKSPERESSNLSVRVAKLEKDLLALSQENKEYHDLNAELMNDLNSKNRELVDLTSTISVLMNKRGKKTHFDGGFEDLSEEQPREKAKENMSPLISERKSARYHHEGHFNRIEAEHEQDSPYDKNLWSKYEELERAYRERCRDITELEVRNKDLLAIVKDWEARFKTQAEHEEALSNQRIVDREKEFHKKAVEIREKCHQDLRVQEEKFKETMDTLEAEFKKILLENRDKIADLKSQYQGKCEALQRLEEMVQNQTKEPEDFQRKLREKDGQIRTLQIVTEKLEKEKSKLANELAEYRLATPNKTQRGSERAKSVIRLSRIETGDVGNKGEPENFSSALEDRALSTKEQRLGTEAASVDRGANSFRRNLRTYETKGDNPDLFKSLNEKEQAIQSLQKELQSRDQELARSRERLVESRNAYNEEIQDQRKINQHLQEEINKLKELFRQRDRESTSNNRENAHKKQSNENGKLQKELLLQLERENQELAEELESAQQSLKDKELQVSELEENLNENRAVAVRYQNRAQTLEDELRARDSEIEKSLKVKEKEIESLRKKLVLNQEEMKSLVQEIEKQKLIAQENMEKINLIFK